MLSLLLYIAGLDDTGNREIYETYMHFNRISYSGTPRTPCSNLFNYYIVMLFGIFMTMTKTSYRYIEKFLIKRLVLPESGTLNHINLNWFSLNLT